MCEYSTHDHVHIHNIDTKIYIFTQKTYFTYLTLNILIYLQLILNMYEFRQNNILKKEAKNGQLKKMLNWEIFKF